MQVSRFLRSAFVVLSTLAVLIVTFPGTLQAQSNSGIVQGTVVDPSKAAVPGAKVRLENPVSGHVDEVETGTDGSFRIANIPLNPYHLTVTAQGFNTVAQDVDVRSTVPISLTIGLTLGTAATNITVTENAADLIEVTPTEHTDVDRQLFRGASAGERLFVDQFADYAWLPPESPRTRTACFTGSATTPKIPSPWTASRSPTKQSKVFSNQIPEDSVQSMEVIEGAPPAEYGGKTSVVVDGDHAVGSGRDHATRRA